MRIFQARRTWLIGAIAVFSMMSVAHAQSVSTFLGGSGTSDLAQTGWTTAGNWNTGTVATGTGVWARINSSTATILRINYGSSAVGVTGTLSVGAISFLPTLTVATGSTYEFRNSSTGTKGTLRFYGLSTTIDGTARTIILDNQTTLADVGVSQASAGQDYELFASGAINVAGNTSLTLSPLIRDGGATPRSITKIGTGILSFAGVSYGGSTTNSSTNSTYSGGFIMNGGVVQWAASGVSGTNPFGAGAMTLRSGTLRSTTATGKSINSSVVLDGSITLGSADPSFNGNITVNSDSGLLTTTIASNSVVTIAGSGSTAWNQSTSGAGSFTKAGPGLLRFSPLSTLAHTGSTVVQEGTLIMAGTMTSASPVSILNAATLLGTGSIAGATSILAGGTFSPGAVSGATGVFTFGSGGLSLAGQSLLEVAGAARGTQYDGVDIGGALGYGGSLLLQFSGTVADGTTLELFRGFASQAGTFSSITVAGAYSGSLSESAGVWTGRLGGQDFTFTNSTGNLVIVPEPAVSLLAVLGGGVAAMRCVRRFRRRS